jgi:hypothetical protein
MAAAVPAWRPDYWPARGRPPQGRPIKGRVVLATAAKADFAEFRSAGPMPTWRDRCGRAPDAYRHRLRCRPGPRQGRAKARAQPSLLDSAPRVPLLEDHDINAPLPRCRDE